MSKISDRIRAYVNDPSVADQYGEWGAALRPDQRRQIRQLCDVCDMYEKTADMAAQLGQKASDLEYTLMGVMLFVDKWLEGEELNQHEVNRAATMREKTLQIVERLQADRSKGEWVIVYQNKMAVVYECSCCKHLTFATSDYCICGAKMKGE